MNAIVAYMLCHPISLPGVIANQYVSGLATLCGSGKDLVLATAAFAVLWLFLYWMYRNRNFLRI